MIQTKTMECPACGASLPWREGLRELRCEYCGSLVTVEDDRAMPPQTAAEKPRPAEKKEPPLSPEDAESVRRLDRHYRMWKYVLIAFTVLSVILIGESSGKYLPDNFWAGVLITAVTGWTVVAKKSGKEALRAAVLRVKGFSRDEKETFLRLRKWRRVSMTALAAGGVFTGAGSADVWVTAAIAGAVGWAITARKLREL